jgi:hypothetical protein
MSDEQEERACRLGLGSRPTLVSCPHEHGEGCLAHDMPDIERCKECW